MNRIYLLSIHQVDNFQCMQLILALVLGANDVQHQIEDASLLKRPEHLIMHACIVVRPVLVRICRYAEHITYQH